MVSLECEGDTMTKRILRTTCRLIAEEDYKRGCRPATWIVYWNDPVARPEIERLIAREVSMGTPRIRIPRQAAMAYCGN